GFEILHADWPAYPRGHGIRSTLNALAEYPRNTRFFPIDNIDQCTLFAVGEKPKQDPQRWWPQYLELLRREVAWLISDLKTKQMLGWYSFLLHGRSSGVPTTPDDQLVYVHLRLESLVPVGDLIRPLPGYCAITRHMHRRNPPSLNHVQIAALRDRSVE